MSRGDLAVGEWEEDYARLIARLTAGELARDMGPMVVPDAAAAAFAEMARYGGQYHTPVYGTGQRSLLLISQFTQRGTLQLGLELDAARIWSGELRAAGGGS